jgi:hypothetical protein
MSALDDRRQQAREAAHDGLDLPEIAVRQAIDDAIETATRVQVTPEIIAAARMAGETSWSMTEIVSAAFRAAGFEVVK